ncbi:beta-N-acetylhexosaminidase [Carboxylicivirga sediminis]|uniref:beta-N-acetylhexosaminidase n=1 Tax=Carboxylicivirga sediminis TaxID=2006564 RepID=A0A941FCA0_9BACT|nr:beta-N-acetylhexosaminidase [Carboxylicivirga sediminis]MBR8538085.1 beta-N-acetylhexosaminidase [Carboxylicivirga sediminis]
MMKNKKLGLLAGLLLVANLLIAKSVSVIPQPMKVVEKDGVFKLPAAISIVADVDNGNNASYLREVLMPYSKASIKKTVKKGQGITLTTNANLTESLGEEGYQLEIGKQGIEIKGASAAGVFYGIQTLRQMLPMDASVTQVYELPFVSIEDQPRFSWRAFMLDEARYFKGEEQVKKLLDQMALLKMNVFHWHLTDDQGWRIEIKKYPKLTEVGASRSNTQVGGWDSKERSGKPHSGFYTKEQIKGIISYAQQRHITIVPEIEMPGHASAAIAAYPWLGTIGELTEVPVVFGKLPDSFNVADARVYEFLEDVLDEVMALFPENIVHIGGDEVRFEAWKNSEKVQDFMAAKGLKTPADLQVYFTNRISNYLDANKHRMMGWNEILGGNVHEWQKAEDVEVSEQLAKSAIIHFWKGSPELINEAVQSGYDIVNSYHIYSYLDYSYEYIPLEKAYEFNPIPDGLDAKYHHKVLGSGCQMWGEWIPEVSNMDNMVFPRLAAYAEVGWTAHEKKDYQLFRANLDELIAKWKNEGIQVAPSFEKKDVK